MYKLSPIMQTLFLDLFFEVLLWFLQVLILKRKQTDHFVSFFVLIHLVVFALFLCFQILTPLGKKQKQTQNRNFRAFREGTSKPHPRPKGPHGNNNAQDPLHYQFAGGERKRPGELTIPRAIWFVRAPGFLMVLLAFFVSGRCFGLVFGDPTKKVMT